MASEAELNKWKKEHCKGIRNKSLINLMLAESRLKNQYKKLKKDDLNYNEYIKAMDRIKDIAKILNCSERTARDYRDALIYFIDI